MSANAYPGTRTTGEVYSGIQTAQAHIVSPFYWRAQPVTPPARRVRPDARKVMGKDSRKKGHLSDDELVALVAQGPTTTLAVAEYGRMPKKQVQYRLRWLANAGRLESSYQPNKRTLEYRVPE